MSDFSDRATPVGVFRQMRPRPRRGHRRTPWRPSTRLRCPDRRRGRCRNRGAWPSSRCASDRRVGRDEEATSSARSRADPAGTTSSTTPSSCASVAPSLRAVKIMLAALDQPTRRVSSWVPPPPGMTPTLTSGSPTVAPSPATMRSHDRAISKPPPSANPSTAATTGTGSVRTRRMPPGRAALRAQLVVAEGVALLEVGADAEGPLVGAGDDDGPDRVVAGELGGSGADGLRHRGGHGVHRLGPVEHQLGDVAALAVSLDAHQDAASLMGGPLSGWCGARRGRAAARSG